MNAMNVTALNTHRTFGQLMEISRSYDAAGEHRELLGGFEAPSEVDPSDSVSAEAAFPPTARPQPDGAQQRAVAHEDRTDADDATVR